MTKKNTEKVGVIIDKLLEMFETGEMPKAIATTFIRRKDNGIPSDTWSISNRVIMYMNDAFDARTYKDWEKVGRRPKKGTAFYIFKPIMRKLEIENEKEEMEEKIIPISFAPTPRFKYEDTYGKEIEIHDYQPKELPKLLDVAKALGYDVKYLPFVGKSEGTCNGVTKTIKLRTYDDNTFFHELAHAVHNTFSKLKGGQNKQQEIVAEMVAAVMCQIYGLEGYITDSFNYIKHYARTEEPKNIIKEINKVLNDVEKILIKIFEMAEIELDEVV